MGKRSERLLIYLALAVLCVMTASFAGAAVSWIVMADGGNSHFGFVFNAWGD